MLLQRKNDSRDASSMSLRRRAAGRAAAGCGRRILLHPQQEVRIDQHPFERELNARVEAAALAPAAREEPEQRLHVAGRDRTPVRQPSHPRQDRRGAGSAVLAAPRQAGASGWQTKIARRLGVSVTVPAARYGPPIWTEPTAA